MARADRFPAMRLAKAPGNRSVNQAAGVIQNGAGRISRCVGELLSWPLNNPRSKGQLLYLTFALWAAGAPAQQLYTGSAGVVAADVDKCMCAACNPWPARKPKRELAR